ncbi:MAG: hypothetical protein CM1200mP20_08990 [Pseudomonadota bacterium]|nr:MAG: hypothetical protein CM1200mP20_08990 [Pseudomonadota bacterium]
MVVDSRISPIGNQVWGLAHCINQASLERVCVNADFALINDAIDVVVDKLDRVLKL